MNTIKITKMQGCGNDFVIIDYSEFEKTNMEMSDLAKKSVIEILALVQTE